jgi:FlaA1/EpsC-like NDP-sugar epimerase
MTSQSITTSESSLLKGKHAVVFGAGGSIGAAVAKDSPLKARKSF